jgi:hypothetical protein
VCNVNVANRVWQMLSAVRIAFPSSIASGGIVD